VISPFSSMMDYVVEQHFRKDASGRSVFLPLVRRGQGYVIDSKVDEEKIRAFVKMYRSSMALLSVLGSTGIYVWGWSPIFHAGLNPLRNRVVALAESGLAFLLIYVGWAWLLWSVYKKTVPIFTSSLSQVEPGAIAQLTKVPHRNQRIALVFLFAGLVLAAFGILGATQYKPPRPRAQQPAAACPDTPCSEK
jgi:hypothetical protein